MSKISYSYKLKKVPLLRHILFYLPLRDTHYLRQHRSTHLGIGSHTIDNNLLILRKITDFTADFITDLLYGLNNPTSTSKLYA